MGFLDELYYGNINLNENRNRRPLPYEKAVKTFSDIESKLTKELNDENLKIFNDLVNSSDEISATSGVENFKMGFGLGVLMMCDCLLFDSCFVAAPFTYEQVLHLHRGLYFLRLHCKYCICYYDENYAPPRRRNRRRDLFDYQPKSGTAGAYEYSMKKKKEIINYF